MPTVWQIDVGYFCAGLESENGVVVRAAPILKWTIGKKVSFVRKWVNSKRGKMILVSLDKCSRNDDNKVPNGNTESVEKLRDVDERANRKSNANTSNETNEEKEEKEEESI